jgi:hypothetical protein
MVGTIITVRDHLDRVHNVILIECIFGSGKPRGVGILGKGSTWTTERTRCLDVTSTHVSSTVTFRPT